MRATSGSEDKSWPVPVYLLEPSTIRNHGEKFVRPVLHFVLP